MIGMNPFDLPPSTPPVSIEPPDPPAPRRGRMAIVALASAGLLAGGAVGLSALVSADDPELEPAPEASGVAAAATDDETSGDDGDDGGEPEGDGLPSIEGEIVIETGDGEPIVIDVGELADLAKDQLAQLEECTGVPLWLDMGPMFSPPDGEFGEFDGDLDEMFEKFEEMLGEWTGDGALLDAPLVGDGMFAEEIGSGEVTVMGPDGVTVVDLGDGDGSVTVSRDGETGEITLTTEGTATETPLDDLFGELLGEFELPENFDLDDLQLGEFFPEGFDELMKDFSGESFEFGDLDPQQIADCLADLD